MKEIGPIIVIGWPETLVIDARLLEYSILVEKLAASAKSPDL